MKKSIAMSGCLAIMIVAFSHEALADQQYDRQGMPVRYQENGDISPDSVKNANARRYSFDPVAYNNDTEGRNRGQYYTGANMGPGGRNSGFDDNEALHESSSRHINDTAVFGGAY